MVTVHHLENSRSQRVLWPARRAWAAGYELVIYKRDPRALLAPPTLRKVHPLCKSPVIVDGDARRSLSRVRSSNILSTPKRAERRVVSRRTASPEKLRYTYWLHYAEGSAMPPLLLSLVFCALAEGADAGRRQAHRGRALGRRCAAATSRRRSSCTSTGWNPNSASLRRGSRAIRSALADIQMSYPIGGREPARWTRCGAARNCWDWLQRDPRARPHTSARSRAND